MVVSSSPVPFTPLEVQSLWLGRLVTFHFVCLGWVVFYVGTIDRSLGHAWDILWALTSGWLESPELANPLVILVIAGAIAAQYVPPLLARQWSAMFSTLPPAAVAVGFALWIMVVVHVISFRGCGLARTFIMDFILWPGKSRPVPEHVSWPAVLFLRK